MKLTDLKPAPGSRKKRTRVGRGRSSGLGKTSGKGQKGQGAHNKHPKPGFEGGQTPMARRFPKRGFSNFHRVEYAVINVADLERAASRLSGEMDAESLKKGRIIADTLSGLRVLGDGSLTKAVTIKALHFSKSAKEKIEKAGGKAIVLADPKKVAIEKATAATKGAAKAAEA